MSKQAAADQLQLFVEELVNALIECLQGRTWEGKDDAVAALVAIAGKCKDTVRSGPLASKVWMKDASEKATQTVVILSKRHSQFWKIFSTTFRR